MEKILVAMNSFKGTLSSKELSELIKENYPNTNVDFNLVTISDGGEGFIDSVSSINNSIRHDIVVQDAFGKPIESAYIITRNNEAIMEIAKSSGLELIDKAEMNPYLTSTYGLGQTVLDALGKGVKRIIIGLGGSSTNDGGAGMLQALGIKFNNNAHKEIKRLTGASISEVTEIDVSHLDSRLNQIEIIVACDVDNPLLGVHGCSKVYAGQKGASKEMIGLLEENMKHYSKIVIEKLGKDDRGFPGSGAAGGLGFALKTFLNANLRSGFEIVSRCIDLESMIKSSDIIITGEGKLDKQSFYGKAPINIAKLGKKHHKKVIGIFGQSDDIKDKNLFDEIYCIVPEIASVEESLKNPKETFIKLIKTLF